VKHRSSDRAIADDLYSKAWAVALLIASCVFLFSFSFAAFADSPTTSPAIAHQDVGQNYIARIKLHTAEEITDLFDRAEALLDQEGPYSLGQPIAFVLHGPEVEYFSRTNYSEYKRIVDKAAQLDAFRLIDVRVCATYLRENGISPDSLPPFVEVVPYGPDEELRLKAKGYQDF
jgi:uncharacterized protein